MAQNRSKVIIGIHGLANKPPEEELRRWWKQSLVEGLENIGVENPELDFRIVYWAKLLYKYPLHREPYMQFDKLYDDEPYEPADPRDLKAYKDSWRDDLRAAARGFVGSTVDKLKESFGMDKLADWALGELLRDLDFYYQDRKIPHAGGSGSARKVLKEVLARTLEQASGEGKEILLIAHSMGTIISYDALRDLGNVSGNQVEIARYVTIGSPLGLPHVKWKIIEEREGSEKWQDDPVLRTPSIVTGGWTNFADRKDPVAADLHLADDYGPNRSGVVVRDDLVANDYCATVDRVRKENHHKSYGYLRTPELSACVKDFLEL